MAVGEVEGWGKCWAQWAKGSISAPFLLHPDLLTSASAETYFLTSPKVSLVGVHNGGWVVPFCFVCSSPSLLHVKHLQVQLFQTTFERLREQVEVQYVMYSEDEPVLKEWEFVLKINLFKAAGT